MSSPQTLKLPPQLIILATCLSLVLNAGVNDNGKL